MQLRAALVEVRNELEKQTNRQFPDKDFKHPDLHMIEEVHFFFEIAPAPVLSSYFAGLSQRVHKNSLPIKLR